MTIPRINPLRPTLSVPIFGGEVTVHSFGREHGANFSFKGIDDSWAVQSDYGQIFGALASIHTHNDFFAPSPVLMNAELVQPEELCGRCFRFPSFSSLHESFSLQRGIQADGLSGLTKKHGYIVSAADCALVAVKNDDLVIAAHAGRNSVIDMNYMKGGEKRENESVVHAILKRIVGANLDIQRTHVWIGFSISPGPHFAHAINDHENPHNRKMVEYVARHYGPSCFKQDGQGGTLGWLDVKELIRRQFLSLGVPEGNIELDSVCTYSDQDATGEYLWYSNKRQLVAGEEQKRNLFAVVVN